MAYVKFEIHYSPIEAYPAGIICGCSLRTHEGGLSSFSLWCHSFQWFVDRFCSVYLLTDVLIGVVEAIVNDWEYFEVIRKAANSECMSRLETAVLQIDSIIADGKHVKALKALFGLQNITHDVDFVSTISASIINLS